MAATVPAPAVCTAGLLVHTQKAWWLGLSPAGTTTNALISAVTAIQTNNGRAFPMELQSYGVWEVSHWGGDEDGYVRVDLANGQGSEFFALKKNSEALKDDVLRCIANPSQ